MRLYQSLKHEWRSRWAAIGAAVAVTLGAGGLAITNAVGEPGTPSRFAPMTPCRLFDTRPESAVGARTTALAGAEILTQQVTGASGNCTVPATATAVALNVTAVSGTADSFLTVWPADEPRPLASSLNWAAGDPPNPNKVDVKLSPDGKINVYNNGGTVHVVADVVGFYTTADVIEKATLTIGYAAFQPQGSNNVVSAAGCRYSTVNVVPLSASVPIPVGATITSVKLLVIDAVVASLTVNLERAKFEAFDLIGTVSSVGDGGAEEVTMTLTTPEVVDAGEYFTLLFLQGAVPIAQHQICGAEIDYTIPD